MENVAEPSSTSTDLYSHDLGHTESQQMYSVSSNSKDGVVTNHEKPPDMVAVFS